MSVQTVLARAFTADFWKAQRVAQEKLKGTKGKTADAFKALLNEATEAGKAEGADPRAAILSAIDGLSAQMLADYTAAHPKSKAPTLKAAMQECTGTGTLYQYLSYVRTILDPEKGNMDPAVFAGDDSIPALYRKATGGKGEGGDKDTETTTVELPASVADKLNTLTVWLAGMAEEDGNRILAAAIDAAIRAKEGKRGNVLDGRQTARA